MRCASIVISDKSLIQSAHSFDRVRFDEAIDEITIKQPFAGFVNTLSNKNKFEWILKITARKCAMAGKQGCSKWVCLPWLKSRVATTSNGVMPMLKKMPLMRLDASSFENGD